MSEGPKPTGKEAEFITLNGKVFPWVAGAPLMLTMPGSSGLYLPCFSSAKLLRKTMRGADFAWDSIKCIDDEVAFLTSIYKRQDVRVILDLHRTAEGLVRFTEIQRWMN